MSTDGMITIQIPARMAARLATIDVPKVITDAIEILRNCDCQGDDHVTDAEVALFDIKSAIVTVHEACKNTFPSDQSVLQIMT